MTDEIILQAETVPTEPDQDQRLDGQPEPSAEIAAAPAEQQGPDSQSGGSEKLSDEPAATTFDEDQSPGAEPAPVEEPAESFAEALSAFERSHTHRAETKQLQGTVVSLTADQVVLDVGYKMEGVLPRSAFPDNAEGINPGDSFPVSITGRNEEGYYDLSRHRVAQPRDWSALERAFADKIAVAGTVTALIKGGLSVDVGVRAFMPASRSGTRDAAELEALVGTEITCRITKLDVADEDVVVDRRVVLEEQARGEVAGRRAALKPGDTVTGTVRTLMPYGAFVEIEPGAGTHGIDGLLHISEISRARVAKPEDVLSIGEQLTLRILKIDPETNKISLGLKQLQPEPWETAAERFVRGQRINGAVTRLTDFGAFVELEPGLEGLIHISEMSWAKKVRHPSDLLREGDRVDAVVLSVKPPAGTEQGRISLGLKQTLADPWLEVERKFPAGSQVEGPVTKIMNFGAFVQIAEGVDGLVHVSEIVADRRINHPRDVVREGQRVKAVVLAIDSAKRQIKLSMKQLVPTSIDEYIAEHKVGDTVSGRIVELTSSGAIVELGEGIRATLRAKTGIAAAAPSAPAAAPTQNAAPDLSQLSSMLKDRWKGNAPAPSAAPAPVAEGQIRTLKITKLVADSKKIDVEIS
jgi:small subunit ribosomal protein S1